jgi:hypothetical protein
MYSTVVFPVPPVGTGRGPLAWKYALVSYQVACLHVSNGGQERASRPRAGMFGQLWGTDRCRYFLGAAMRFSPPYGGSRHTTVVEVFGSIETRAGQGMQPNAVRSRTNIIIPASPKSSSDLRAAPRGSTTVETRDELPPGRCGLRR